MHDFVSLAAESLSLLSCHSKLTNQCAQKALSLVCYLTVCNIKLCLLYLMKLHNVTRGYQLRIYQLDVIKPKSK